MEAGVKVESKKTKLKNMKCKDLRCYECPLKYKMCQRFVDNRNQKISLIIEKMYQENELTFKEYTNAKARANEFYDKQ